MTSGPLAVANWRYEFEDTESGCRVTESWDDQRKPWFVTVARVMGDHSASTPSRRWRRRWPTWPPRWSRRGLTPPHSSRRTTWLGGAPRHPGRLERRNRSTTARRCASSTLPPYLNLAVTCSTRISIPRIPGSLAACASSGSATLDAGLEGRQLAAQDRRHAARRGALVVHRRRAGQLHRPVVRGRDPERRILPADGLPRRRDEGPVVGHAEQHPRVLGQGAEHGIGPHEVQPHRVAGQHELRGHDDGKVALGTARGDQVPEGMRLDEGAPLGLAGAGVDRGDEHRRSLASDRPRPTAARRGSRRAQLPGRPAPPSTRPGAACSRPCRWAPARSWPTGRTRRGALYEARRSFTWAISSLSRRQLGAVGRLHHRHDLLAVGRVGDADDDGVAHGLVRLERLLDLLGEDLLAARVDADRAAAEQVDGAVGVDLGEVAGDGVAHAVDHLERPLRLLLVLVVAERVAPAEGEDARSPRTRRSTSRPSSVSTLTSGPSVNDAVLAAAPPPETDMPHARAPPTS